MNRSYVSIIFLAGALVWAFFFTWPSLQDLQALLSQKHAKRAELETKEEYFANLKSLQAELQGFTKELAKLDLALPEDPSLPSLYQLLQEVSARSGVLLKSIGASVQKSETSLQTIELQLKVAGPYESFKQFLQNIQSAWRMLSVDSLTFLSGPAGKVFEMSLQLSAYSY